MKVKQAMHTGVDWRSPDTPLTEIAQLMRDHDIGAVPVGKNDRLVGMVTDRDIICRGLANGGDISAMKAGDVMTEGISYCTSEDDVEDAIHLMEQKRIRRLAVLDDNRRLVGMLSMGDLAHVASRELTGELAAAVCTHH